MLIVFYGHLSLEKKRTNVCLAIYRSTFRYFFIISKNFSLELVCLPPAPKKIDLKARNF